MWDDARQLADDALGGDTNVEKAPENQASNGLTLYFLGKLHSGLKKLSAYYRQRGVKVYNITSPEDLERALATSSPHALIIDLQSRSDVTRFFDTLGQYEGLLEMPRIAIISSSTDADTVEALQTQADESVLWPLKATDLSLKLFNLLASRGRFVRFQRDVRDEEGRFYRGDLYPTFLRDILQLLYMGRKDSIVSVESEGRRGNLYFKEGRLIDAQVGALEWEDSLNLIRRFKGGNFGISFQPVDRKRFIEKDVMAMFTQAEEEGELPPVPEPGEATAVGPMGTQDPETTLPTPRRAPEGLKAEPSGLAGVAVAAAAAAAASVSTARPEGGNLTSPGVKTNPSVRATGAKTNPAVSLTGLKTPSEQDDPLIPPPTAPKTEPARPVAPPVPARASAPATPPVAPSSSGASSSGASSAAPATATVASAPKPPTGPNRDMKVLMGLVGLALLLLMLIFYIRSIPDNSTLATQPSPVATQAPEAAPTPVTIKIGKNTKPAEPTPALPAPTPAPEPVVQSPVKVPDTTTTISLRPTPKPEQPVVKPTPKPETVVVAKNPEIKPTPIPVVVAPTPIPVVKPTPAPTPTPVVAPPPAPVTVAKVEGIQRTETVTEVTNIERATRNLAKAREMEKAGRIQEALTMYTRVAELDPSSREASEAISRLKGTAEISPTAPAELHINAYPYGVVYVDGEKWGYTPVHMNNLVPRKYLIRVVNPDLGACSTEVVLKPGEQRRVQLRLDQDQNCQRAR
ncbi:MAG: DUF4388 domain-containing protein [Myxococcota bacterium]